MAGDGFSYQVPDLDPTETAEWVDSITDVVRLRGTHRARFLMERLADRCDELGVKLPEGVSTPYVNTITEEDQPWFPGDEEMEQRIRAFIRWNAVAMVVRANHRSEGIGGHLSTFASSAALYDVGFNHFWRGKDNGSPGDHVYYQGHAAPGIYARAFLEGRLGEEELDRFRFEIDTPSRTGSGLSSYPHPRLMPAFWEFPTVSMGLGPINSLYHARFNRYLQNRSIDHTDDSTVWCFIGDGETDEPETLGSISLAAREKLDNLVWVVNCNLQRLDGPVRGNGKIIQELEATFSGAGWNVIKVIWGSRWDELLARDTDGLLLKRMNETVDGQFQRYAVESGAYIREHFFGPEPELRDMVRDLSDTELQQLPRGGHDYKKLYAAYRRATERNGRPTVILAKTTKGWTLGSQVESRNATHQIKKMSSEQLVELRNRLNLGDAIPLDSLQGLPPYARPAPGSPEQRYLAERRANLGGSIPRRVVRTRRPLPAPEGDPFAEFFSGSRGQAVSTTVAFTRLMRNLARDGGIGSRIVPIVPDEARTFGMDALFKELEIYASQGQLYEPVDHHLLLSYVEDSDGQILEEGITEAGATASWTAAATAYATRGVPMIPFYTFYSMFGFQRVGDLIWAAADARARGFLMGATAGRTTLAGEGLQHQDGHSLVLASTVPNCQAYDPAFAYETALIVREGLRRMYPTDGSDGDDVFYYVTLYNENYEMPATPEGIDLDELAGDIMRGMYRWRSAPEGEGPVVSILFSGPMWRAAAEAADVLAERFGVRCELWSVTSYKRLREEALEAERHNRLHPGGDRVVSYVERALNGYSSPVVAVSDYMASVPDSISRWVPRRWSSLGTDGFGRSDDREHLRAFFEIDAPAVVQAVLAALVEDRLAAGMESPVEIQAITDYMNEHGDLRAAESTDVPPWKR
jgi:pyruvate dehydrogenase E1 component